MVKDKGVSVKVSTRFFNETFEPARKELEKFVGACDCSMLNGRLTVKRYFTIQCSPLAFNVFRVVQ